MIKVTQICSRCRRPEDTEVVDATAAISLDKQNDRQTEAVKKLTEFLTLNGKDLPDFVAILSREPAKLITHNHLCNDADLKRSCVKRIGELMKQLDTLPERKERKPRAKKTPDVKPIPLTDPVKKK